jgi:integrase
LNSADILCIRKFTGYHWLSSDNIEAHEKCCPKRGWAMAIARKRLTARTVEMLKPAPPALSGRRDGRRFVMDAAVSGFGVKVTETGSRSYVLIKRYPGFRHPAPRELGKCDAMSLEEAREKARAWLRLIARGTDPAEHEREIQLAAARKRENSFAAVAEEFFKDKLASERRGRDVERDMRREFVTAWGNRPIADITTEDVLQVIRAVKQRGTPAFARNLLGYIRRFFDWAIDQLVYGIKINPCVGLKPTRVIGEKRARDRILTDDELFVIWRSAGRIRYPFGPLYRLLLLTGLRLNEVADARWPEFDSRNGVWIIPATRMKGKDGRVTDHVVPITDDIAAILKSLPRFKSGDYLFSSTFGKKAVWVSDSVKKRLDARMVRTLRAMARKRGDDPSKVMLPHFVNHDLRRTLRTGLSKLRVDRDIREAVLGHTRPGVEGIYDRHDYLLEKKDALERWASYVRNLSSHEVEATNIVRLRG